MNKEINKKTGEELQQYLAFKRRGSRVENRKGKGSYKRNQKHKGREE
jgi:stalled ribosome alternative rescue factor ArfA